MFRKLRHFESFDDIRLFLYIIALWYCLPVILLLPVDRILRLFTPANVKALDGKRLRQKRQKVTLFTTYWFSRPALAKRNTCLKTALVSYYFLTRCGLPVRFCIGVRRNASDAHLSGHSWIERLDEPLCDTGFIRTFTYPSSGV